MNDIESYVARLTPVLLTNDTLVTNHGYTNGRANPLQSILQAGTAVMVDSTGTPRVKCNCGNPLTPPAAISVHDAHIIGDPWPGYTPGTVTTIQPGKTTDAITLVDIHTGDHITQPLDGGGGDGLFVEAEFRYGERPSGSHIMTSPDGATWSETGIANGANVTGIAWGQGKWIAVGPPADLFEFGSLVMESSDLRTWTQVATLPHEVNALAYSDGRWVAVGDDGENQAISLPFSKPIAYSSTDGSTWTEGSVSTDSDDNRLRMVSVAHGADGWRAIGTDEPSKDRDATPTYKVTTYTSDDGTQWKAVRPSLPVGDRPAAIASAEGTWLEAVFQLSGRGILSRGTDGTSWAVLPGATFDRHAITGIAHGNNRWLVVSTPSLSDHASATGGPSTFYASRDLKSWKHVNTTAAQVTALAFGGDSPTSSAADTDPYEGDWDVTYGAPGVVTIKRSGDTYTAVAKTPIRVVTAGCSLPPGTTIFSFSADQVDGSFAGEHGLWSVTDCSFARQAPLKVTPEGPDTLRADLTGTQPPSVKLTRHRDS